jgi:putative flippase GtrA
MSDLQRRGTRSQRVDRAYRLTLATGTCAIGAVVAVVLAIAGVVSLGWALLAAVAAVACALLLRRLVSPR